MGKKIEFAFLYDNHTWDTEVVDVPEGVSGSDADIKVWADTKLLARSRYRKAVLCCVYNDNL